MKIDLNRPFPYPILDGVRPKLQSAAAFSGFIFLFLLVFKPFGLNEVEGNITLVTLGFGGVTFVVLLASTFIVPKLLPSFFDRESWTVLRTIVFGSCQFFTISILNWIYSAATCGTPLDITGFGGFILITLAVGIIPATFVLLIMEQVLSNQKSAVASNVFQQITAVKSQKPEQHTITLASDNGKDEINFDPENLVCIKSEGNYAEVTFLENQNVKKKLLRNTLSKLMTDLESEALIKQCHRSYIVNFSFVDEITGNARNYNLHIPIVDLAIPVSRSFSKDFINRFRNA